MIIKLKGGVMFSDRDKAKIVSEILRNNNTIVISTKDSKGKIWSTKVYYGEDCCNVYVILEKSGNAYKNILENPEVFFVIDKNDPMAFIQGVAEAEILGDTKEVSERSIVTRKNFGIIPFLKFNPDTVVVRLKLKKLYVSYFVEGVVPRFEVEVDDYFRELLKKEYSKQSKFRYYIQATRPWSFVATISAVIIGTLLSPTVDALKFFLVLVGAILVHAGVNVISDYFDYKKGADRWDTLGSSRVLVEGVIKPENALLWGILLIVLSIIIGGIIWYLIRFSMVFVYLVGIGAVMGLFYTFVGFGWKYLGLGDLAVFVAWTGILFGAYFVQTGVVNWYVILASLPISLLIVAILHGNNMRDIQDDIKSGYKTFAGVLGPNLSKYYYAFLVISSYVFLVVNVILGILPFWVLVSLFSLPLAIKNINWAFKDNYIQKGMLDILTAELLKVNSILIILGLVFYKIVSKI